MKFGLEDLQTKIKDLSTALKTRLDLNKEDVLQAGCLTISILAFTGNSLRPCEQAIGQFDNLELMKESTEEDFCNVWEICKSVSDSNFNSIQQFKE